MYEPTDGEAVEAPENPVYYSVKDDRGHCWAVVGTPSKAIRWANGLSEQVPHLAPFQVEVRESIRGAGTELFAFDLFLKHKEAKQTQGATE